MLAGKYPSLPGASLPPHLQITAGSVVVFHSHNWFASSLTVLISLRLEVRNEPKLFLFRLIEVLQLIG